MAVGIWVEPIALIVVCPQTAAFWVTLLVTCFCSKHDLDETLRFLFFL